MSTAGPSQGAKAPLGGSGPRAAGERGGQIHARVVRRPVHGVLLLDKPLLLSSNQVLQRAKWLLRAEKAGHTGTLDPLATGVLPLCFGAATKFSGLHLNADKSYEAVLQLGVRTSTGDREGEVLERAPVPALDARQLERVRGCFLGTIEQLPPMHSALKKDGRALYEYARAGIEVTRSPRRVQIHELSLSWASQEGDGRRDRLRLAVRCSKGTYIRTLGEDIGAALGCGAHLTALRRVATGPFRQENCITLEQLEALDEGARMACLLPPQALLAACPRIELEAEDAGRFLSGLRRRGPWIDAPCVAVFGRTPPALLGTAHTRAGELIPGRLLNPNEIRQMLDTGGQLAPDHCQQTETTA